MDSGVSWSHKHWEFPKSPSDIGVWSLKNAGELLFGLERPEKACEDMKVLPKEEHFTQP